MPRHAITRSFVHVLPSSAAFVVCASLVACKGPERPHTPAAGSQTIPVGRTGLSLRAVAGDGDQSFVALSGASGSEVEARRGSTLTWSTKLGGNAAAMARAGRDVVVAVGGRGHIETGGAAFTRTPGLDLRGDPGAVLVYLEAASGRTVWQIAVDGSEWSQITSVAAIGDDVVVGGSFGGSLRIADRVVASAGGSDGFVARIHDGKPTWVVRVGGAGADAVQGVAATKDRVAIAGTFTGMADVLGQTFDAFDERLPYADAFVADLDAATGTHRWHSSFGGRGDESVAGVTVDARGNVVVAGSVREVVRVGSQQLVTQGASDGIVVWYTADGGLGASTLVGGLDFDGLRGIAAVGDRVIVGGFFSGTLPLDQAIKADGGDDAFFAALDENGTVVRSWHVGGVGREDIASIASAPGGFVAGVQYSANANVDDESLAAPADPLSGAAIVVRGF